MYYLVTLVYINHREKLLKQLGEYVLETLDYIKTVKEFCVQKPNWTKQRKIEIDKMRDIKAKAEHKNQTWGEYIWSSLTQASSASELEEELGQVLKDTLAGLEKLQHFLDAVEKLAVTSLSIFEDKNESFLPHLVSSLSVRSVIFAAISVSPLLIYFKRDAGAFFLPSLSNVEVLIFQLDKYISVTEQIWEKMEKGY